MVRPNADSPIDVKSDRPGLPSRPASVEIDFTSDLFGLLSRLADLPPAERQALAIDMAARLVEEAAYFTADDQALPVVTRLMSWSHDLSRMSQAFREAA